MISKLYPTTGHTLSLALLMILAWAALGLTVKADDRNPVPNSGTPPLGTVISRIAVHSVADGVTVEITASKLLSPEIQTLSNPERLVLDFPGCQLLQAIENQSLNRGPVVAVRASVFRQNPPVARVVIELSEPHKYEALYAGTSLMIRISTHAGAGPSSGPKADARAPENSGFPPSVSRVSGERKKSAWPPRPQQHAYGLLAKAKTLRVADLDPLEDRAEAGDPEAETTLALAYHAGILLKVDDEQALRLLHQAADQRFLAAQEALGIFYESGFGTPPNSTEAVAWYTKAAQRGSVDAMTSMALIYATGKGGPKDPGRAVQWFRRAAGAGDATAQLNLAAMYRRGEGVPRNDQESLRWLTIAAEQDFIPAMLELAKLNMNPPGAPTDINTAIRWFERAAQLGDGLAQAALGEVFAKGIGGTPDYVQAVSWYRKAADQGQRDGQFGLATLYWQGRGVPADPEQAWHWFTLAANQGHANAQYDLGVIYELGQGAPADLRIAITYYEAAANQGVAEAQYRLGRLLAKGDAPQADKVSAYKWLFLALDRIKDSAVAIAELKKSMKPSEIGEAEQQIGKWRMQHAQETVSR